MNRDLFFFVPMSADQQVEYKSLLEREKALKSDWDAFKGNGTKHPDVAVAARIAAYDGKPKSEIVDHSRFKVTFGIYVASTPKGETTSTAGKNTSYRPPQYVDPKIVNALLHGKLLTDDEKRNLLSAVYPQAMSAIDAIGGMS